ncbi:hypothetical protein [Streptomyces sp. CB01881]|uniref:hypothetical protein n=1 Tax=Streptomyces sp. CB01881 TaxID=2078691 RepID=UPI000CDC7107|nr:hypothetical protein [Streptomyces sp. CB01881]AUY47971.1 hypothetical protein C2142_02180 [Streptomyces sp. CB01881]TYC76450.1 hypothetical protein EH183_02180 [Streptomyces sp. CB01881]
MLNGVGARELYEGLLEHEGPDAYGDVVVPWLDRAQGGYRAALTVTAACNGWWTAKRTDAGVLGLHRQLYALSRVSDLLLLGRQHSDDPVDIATPGLAFPDHEYLGLFGALGMTPAGAGAFDPVLHEIVEVEQADDPRSPIEITGTLWPGLILGDLVFGRAGVRVRAGADHAQRGVADRSPLYWSFRRRHRLTVDLSQGWGGNSQWATSLRLDYRSPAGDRLNVDGDRSIDGSTELDPDHPANLGPEERLLTPRERRDLLRHRCLLRTPEAADELAGLAPWEEELMPFRWVLPADEE